LKIRKAGKGLWESLVSSFIKPLFLDRSEQVG